MRDILDMTNVCLESSVTEIRHPYLQQLLVIHIPLTVKDPVPRGVFFEAIITIGLIFRVWSVGTSISKLTK